MSSMSGACACRQRRVRRRLSRGAILPEIDVDLHADDQRAWFTQLDQRLHDVNVRHVTLAKGVRPPPAGQ
jgi:hypothetical protein